MTVIAYRNGVIAADTLMCIGGIRVGHITKIARNTKGELAGAAGSAIYTSAFRDWFLGKIEDRPVAELEEDYRDRGVIIRTDGAIEVYEDDSMFRLTTAFYAMGSGREVALGAMFAGADAEAAVKAVIALDTGCGGDITVLKLGDTQ